MKKIVSIILLALLIACSAATVAYAETAEQHVKSLATEHEKVIAAECVIYKRACVVAIKTEKFNTKSEYDKYVDELTEQIKADCEVDYVFVSRSPKLMFKLTELNKMSENDRAKAIEELIEQQLQRREKPSKLPPKMLLGNA